MQPFLFYCTRIEDRPPLVVDLVDGNQHVIVAVLDEAKHKLGLSPGVSETSFLGRVFQFFNLQIGYGREKVPASSRACAK